MSDEDAISGSCRCGGVGLMVRGEPLVTMACHCTGCQRMTGSAFSLSSLYPADRFEVADGQTVLGGLKGGTRHHFCPSCMSWLFTRPEGLDDFVNVRATMLDNAGDFVPFVETCTSEKLPFVVTGATFSYPGIPEGSEFPRLIAAFAQRER